MKQYTHRQIDEGMKRVFTSIVLPSTRKSINGVDVFQYKTDVEDFTMNVRLSDGIFFGYDHKTDNGSYEAPIGAIQSIKGM